MYLVTTHTNALLLTDKIAIHIQIKDELQKAKTLRKLMCQSQVVVDVVVIFFCLHLYLFLYQYPFFTQFMVFDV